MLKNSISVCKVCTVYKNLFKNLAGWNLEQQPSNSGCPRKTQVLSCRFLLFCKFSMEDAYKCKTLLSYGVLLYIGSCLNFDIGVRNFDLYTKKLRNDQ